jgi:hypothetical protein
MAKDMKLQLDQAVDEAERRVREETIVLAEHEYQVSERERVVGVSVSEREKVVGVSVSERESVIVPSITTGCTFGLGWHCCHSHIFGTLMCMLRIYGRLGNVQQQPPRPNF